MTKPSTSTARKERPAAASSALTPLGAVYEMRSLRTDAEREEAATLVQDRQRWLTKRILPMPVKP